MKKLFYYTTTALAISCGITQAQTCVPTPTCATLGYSSATACDGGLKCPFGDAWYCPSGDSQDMTELCSLMGYTQTCTGSNQTGGSGQSCGGLYKDCTCDSTADWNGSSCVCKSEYKYSCTGSRQSPYGSSCGGKYASCRCSSPYGWDSSTGTCICAAEYSCTGTNETGGVGSSCNGKYTSCSCKDGYDWVPELWGNGYICACYNPNGC